MSAKPQGAPSGEELQPIIIKKIKKVSGGHHGGSWKVAYADFVTAMMALFLLLWLVGSSSQKSKSAIAGYFRNEPIAIPGEPSPGIGILEGGRGLLGADNAADSLQLVQTQMMLMQQLKESESALSGMSDQVLVQMTEEGLQIEIIDKANNVLFEPGSSDLKPAAKALLAEITRTVSGLDNRIIIGGHTDSRPYAAGGRGYSNWELSTERANRARQIMVEAGLPETHLATVAGYADTRPRLPGNPGDPANRRISVTVLRKAKDPGNPAVTESGEVEPKLTPSLTPGPIGGPIDPHLPPRSLSVGEEEQGTDPHGETVKPEQGQSSGHHHP